MATEFAGLPVGQRPGGDALLAWAGRTGRGGWARPGRWWPLSGQHPMKSQG